MENKADKELGMKWFKFFTKIRSWISIVIYVLLAFSITMQLVEYLKFGSIKDVYVITIFQIVSYAVSAVIYLILVIKTDKYEKAILGGNSLFKYVKAILIYEVAYMIVCWIISKYSEGADNSMIIITSIMCFLIEYFVWYRLNIKYFKRRLLNNMITNITPNENEPSYRIADDSYKTKEYGNHIYTKDIMLQKNGVSAEISADKSEITVQSQAQTLSQEPLSDKIKYCSRCGSKINSETKKCVGCGKQYFRGLKGNKTLTILLIIMLVFSAFLNVYLFTKIGETSTLKREITALKSDKDTLNDTITRLRNQIKQSDAELSVCYQEIEFIDEFVVFVEDNGTNYYHKYQCSEFIGDGFWAFNVEAARGEGYRPCPLCQ